MTQDRGYKRIRKVVSCSIIQGLFGVSCGGTGPYHTTKAARDTLPKDALLQCKPIVNISYIVIHDGPICYKNLLYRHKINTLKNIFLSRFSIVGENICIMTLKPNEVMRVT